MLSAIDEGDDDVGFFSKEIGNFLCENQLLQELNLDCHVVSSVATAALNDFSKVATAVINSDYAYAEKAKYLSALDIISHESKHLADTLSLDFEVLKEQARTGVRAHSDEIEASILETTDWELVEGQLENLEQAKIIDEYTSSEGSARIASLRKLMGQKQTTVDSLVEEHIAKKNFKGLREFLIPLASTRDQIKKQKFQTSLSQIASTLSIIADNTERLLQFIHPSDEPLQQILENLKILREAKEELGKILVSVDEDFRVFETLKKIEEDVNKFTMDFVQKIKRASNSFDFVALGTNRMYANTFERHLKSSFTTATTKAVSQAKRNFDQTVNRCEADVKAFAKSWFENKKLVSHLNSLKSATEQKSPEIPELVVVYHDTQITLVNTLQEALTSLKEFVSQNCCYDDALGLLEVLDNALEMGLRGHITSRDVLSDIGGLRETWESARKTAEQSYFQENLSEPMVVSWKKRLEGLDPKTWRGALRSVFSGVSFDDFRRKVNGKVMQKVSSGTAAMQGRSFYAVGQTIKSLEMMERHLSHYIPSVREGCNQLKDQAFSLFRDLCSDIKEVLLCESRRREFQRIYEVYRKLVCAFPCIVLTRDNGREFKFTNQLVFETLQNDLDKLSEWKETFDLRLFRERLQKLRHFGGYIADFGTLFHQEVKSGVLGEDQWLSKTFQICQEHFYLGRDFANINLYAILGLPPSSTKQDIEKAYRLQAKDTHPDKQNPDEGSDSGKRFLQVKDAKEKLLALARDSKSESQSLDSNIRNIPWEMRQKVKALLADRKYSQVETVLVHLDELDLLNDLVSPPLDSARTCSDIMDMVRGEVERIKKDIDSNWADRKYQLLNGNIADLKSMESKLKGHPDFFATSWYKSILNMVEQEIESLRQKTKSYISDQSTAISRMQDFRRCFIEMGKVLVELAPFREFTKIMMSEVLESCLKYDWGYSYLFDLGLGLRRSDEGFSEEDNVVAQTILTEFRQFKEVLTMVWNEETTQKPVEETVKEIYGVYRPNGSETKAQIDTDLLLKSYWIFEAEYRSLLGSFLPPESDLGVLVDRVTKAAYSIKPCSCSRGWAEATKKQIPLVLAGIFAVFTILKSGESYNRVEASGSKNDIGDKMLMKPHNIQVLTLLCMFGCASLQADSLESQLMQIRTGEGKSIILGAAAVLLSLFGFRVRCVCYSEYLSTRDYNLFSQIFEAFHLENLVTYSKITTLSEDSTARKGNIRVLSEKLFRGELNTTQAEKTSREAVGYLVPSSGRQTHTALNESIPVRHQTNASNNSELGPPSLDHEDHPSNDTLSNPESCHQKSAGNSLSSIPTGSVSQCVTSESLHRMLSNVETKSKVTDATEAEILLVDEVDVFFGSEFYGQTYNQVVQIQDDAVETILRQIWSAHKTGGRRLRLDEIKVSQAYSALTKVFPNFEYILESEVTSMLNEVSLVDEEPYYVDKQSGRIGYKVMDSVSFEAVYGYRTVFAYLKEADKGNLTDKDVAKHLAMQVSCGRFSYANISPSRVLGVSGTLDATGEYEKDVLAKYGLQKFLFVPSVYGKSNFSFDKAGNGIRIDKGRSDYFHSITERIQDERKRKRAVIVFFHSKQRMDEYIDSPFYGKLNSLNVTVSPLKEDMTASEKEHAISRAATSGQVTLCTAVFGRGTDFFCKDDRVQQAGGVLVLQTFFSDEVSEEIQIQGRTARQGKKGSYELILLESDLSKEFGIREGAASNVPKEDIYSFLEEARRRRCEQRCRLVEKHLSAATSIDTETHKYFDALLDGDSELSGALLCDLHRSFKKANMPSEITIDIGFVVDQTGSMAQYTAPARNTLKAVISGNKSISEKLKAQFPGISFVIRYAVMGYRDVDDGNNQYMENRWGGEHFIHDPAMIFQAIDKTLSSPSGGGDIAEDHLGAILRASKWESATDWTSEVKFMVLLTDAPAHGMVPPAFVGAPNADSYSLLHPSGLKVKDVVGSLIAKDIDLCLCSFDPKATKTTESKLSENLISHPDNTGQRDVIPIPLVDPKTHRNRSTLTDGYGKHMVFVLDESGSMSNHWSGVVTAYNEYLNKRNQTQCSTDLVSVVQFQGGTRTTVRMKELNTVCTTLDYRGGGTCFYPAALSAKELVLATPSTHVPVVVFMSDGCAGDATQAASTFSSTNQSVKSTYDGNDLELHVIAFRGGASTSQLQAIANASPRGKVYTSATTAQLSDIFGQIASGEEVATVLQAEVAKRISEAVADRLSIEYLAASYCS